MIFVVEARDPNDGATVMVVCRTRAEAVAAVTGFLRAGHQITKVTDRNGTIVRFYSAVSNIGNTWMPEE
jgi:hypothetical protein